MKTLNGRKYLDANDYKKISITETNDKFSIKVTGEDKKDINYAKGQIGEEIKSLSDEEAILYIIDYYLRYNEIISTADAYNYKHTKKGIELTSSSNRQLFISVRKNMKNAQEIIKKFNNGFRQALLNNLTRDDIDFVVIDFHVLQENSFHIKNELYKDETGIYIFINKNDKKTIEFLMKTMFERLKDTDNKIEFVMPEKKRYLGPNYHLYDSNIFISNENISFSINNIPGHTSEFVDFIKEEVHEFNKEKEEIKVRQLKMGGF